MNFSGTRFSERKYFFINENIGQHGAGEGLDRWGHGEVSKLGDK